MIIKSEIFTPGPLIPIAEDDVKYLGPI
jgi:hypothetical protein